MQRGRSSRGSSPIRPGRARIEKTGVRFYGSHVGLRFGADELHRWIDLVAALGAERFVISGEGKSLVKGGRLDEEALGKKVESLRDLAEHCRHVGLRLAYHNHGNEFEAAGVEIVECSGGPIRNSSSCSSTWGSPTARGGRDRLLHPPSSEDRRVASA